MFAGIGSQHKALTNLKKQKILNFKIVGTSEWFIDAILAYDKIHFKNATKKVNNIENKFQNLLDRNITLSLNSKDPYLTASLIQKSDKWKTNLLKAFNCMNNFGSITEIKGKDLRDLDIDVITYSFPCQDLSTAGFFWNKSKGMDKNSNTRSSLVWHVGRILQELKKVNSIPKILIMENVKSILNKTHKIGFEKWINFLLKLGYKTFYKILNGIEFGMPQRRERVIAISCLKEMEYSEEMWNLYQKEYLVKYKKETKLIELLKSDYSNENYYDESLSQIPNNTPSRLKMFKKCKNLGNSNFCWTISTKQDRFPNAGIIHFNEKERKLFASKNNNFRFLTPRECFLLMGFSEKDYENVRSLKLAHSSEFLLAGNSIIINVLESVFYVVNKILEKNYYEKNC